MEIIMKCPICGNEGKINIKINNGFDGFLDYFPPDKWAYFVCPECGLMINSKLTENLDFPDLDLIKEVQDKLTIGYSQEIIEKVGKLVLLHLEKDLKWEEILHRLKTLQNLIYERRCW